MTNFHKDLLKKGLINEDQYDLFDRIERKKVVSLFYELRLLLYLGVLLLTGGVGYIAYENIGEIGHIVMMVLLLSSILFLAYYINRFSLPYSNRFVEVSHIYFDHILLLFSLLVVGLFTYFQIYFNLVHQLLNWSSYVSMVLFFFIAYRYDHRGVLSMGIVALSASFGLSVSPINWVKAHSFNIDDVYLVSIGVGLMLVLVSEYLNYKKVKPHFTFTYQNFGFILFYFGCLYMMFDSSNEWISSLLVISVSLLLSWLTWVRKEFLLFLYSSVTLFVSFTFFSFLFLDLIDGEVLLLYYLPFSLIGFVVFLVSKKNHFTDE